MTGHDAMDQRLHDYLDGRLSEPERKDFETRLKRDPELAASAEFLWRLRRVLRESPSDLPTGFLARARARFDESRAVRRFRPRWVSWEVAGLAAAALVVTAILIPYYHLWPTSTAPEEASRLSPPAAPLSDLEKKAPLDKVEPLREEKREEKRDRQERAGVEGYVQAPEKPKPKTHPEEESSRQKPVPEEVARNEAAPSSQQEPVGAGTRALKDSGAPTQVENRRWNQRKDAVDDEMERPVATPAPSPLLKTVAGRAGSEQRYRVIPRVEPLPANSLLPESLQVVKAANDPVWRELLSGPTAGPLRRLHPDFEHEQVVLIGPLPTPFSCTGLGVAYEAGTARIRLVPPGAGESGASGCAVVIPADASHVEIVNPSHE